MINKNKKHFIQARVFTDKWCINFTHLFPKFLFNSQGVLILFLFINMGIRVSLRTPRLIL